MARVFLILLLSGRKNFSDIPERYKDEVKNLLIEKIQSGNSTAKKILEGLNDD